MRKQLCLVFLGKAMVLETYALGKRDEIHTDVLLKARQACYKVSLFILISLISVIYCKKKHLESNLNVVFIVLDLGKKGS